MRKQEEQPQLRLSDFFFFFTNYEGRTVNLFEMLVFFQCLNAALTFVRIANEPT